MEIAEQLALLAELQSVEQKLRAARTHLEELPQKAKEAQADADQKATRHAELDRQRIDLEAERRRLESDLAAEKDKLRKWQARADQIRGEREHAALASEISSQKRAISRVEDLILEKMQGLEDVTKSLAAATEDADAAKTLADEEWAKVKDDVKAAEDVVDGIDKGRRALLERLPVPVVKRYERVAQARGGLGVAVIKGETCQACMRTLPPQLCIQVYRGQVLESCPSCQRILVHEAMTKSAGTEAAEEAAGGSGDDDVNAAGAH